MRSFLPPYGDGTMKIAYCAVCKKFSPPYGDKSKSALQGLDRQQMTFPSPCGDKLKSGTRTLMAWQRSFRPLTGMVRKSSRLSWASISFRPLTGMVLCASMLSLAVPCFRPPYGDCTKSHATQGEKQALSPPCGVAPLYHGGGQIEIPFQGEP